MKCSNCNSELLEGAKFCTTCGSPVKQENTTNAEVCSECGAALLPNAKFCTTCGAPRPATNTAPTSEETPSEGGNIAMVKQKIYWNVSRGEVACHINEVEFTNYDNARGLIINDGTTAYVKANGKVIAELHGGIYEFVSSEEVTRVLESRHGGLGAALNSMGRFIVNMFLGRKVKDDIARHQGAQQEFHSLDELIASLKRHDVFSLQLKLDKEFALIFGGEDGAMVVQTKYLDMPIAMRAKFRISNFEAFSRQYFADERVMTTRRLAELLKPTVQSALQAVMLDMEVSGNQLTKEVADEVLRRLSSVDMNGVSILSVDEVVASNEDLERLRSLSREIYLSEKELDYLRRTNDFRNRLTMEVNNQQITDARSDLQLYQGLQEVNKDRLLTDDELDKFYTLLSREKRIRDARSEDEVATALAEIEKTGLLREEDVENLRIDIAERRYKRGEVIRLMQLRDAIEFEKVRTAGEAEIAINVMRNNIELEALSVEQQRITDAYADERRKKEMELRHAERMSEIDADRAEMDVQLEQLRRVKEMNREDKRLENEHELAMERARQEALDKKAQMSAEQLMALAAGENMESDAARAFAESFSAGRNYEQAQQAAEVRAADAQRHEAQMMEIIREMARMNSNMATGIAQQKADQREEYERKMERQEARAEHAYDSALEYATRNNYAQATTARCPKCGATAEAGTRFCHNCGYDMKQ